MALLVPLLGLVAAKPPRPPKVDPTIIKGTIRVPKGPREDPFRFLHYRQSWPGQALQEIDLRIEGTRLSLEVIYLGQSHHVSGEADPGMRTALVRYLRELEAWPQTDGGTLACIAFGDGPATHEAAFGTLASPEPALDRFLAAIRIEAMQEAYIGELSRYATDEPSLAAGTIEGLLRESKSGILTVDDRLLAALNGIAIDRTVRPLVRDAATAALAAFGRTPVLAKIAEEPPAPEKPRPKKTEAPPPAAPEKPDEPMSD